MFNFLTFFAAGASAFNTYAQLKASKERSRAMRREQEHGLRMQEENARFSQAEIKERKLEHAAISSYQVDSLRQDQLLTRQQLAHNMLSAGVGISSTTSEGQLLRHMAYSDEMKARSAEAELFYNRPRNNFNPNILNMQRGRVQSNLRSIKQAAPFTKLGIGISGITELASIARMSGIGQ